MIYKAPTFIKNQGAQRYEQFLQVGPMIYMHLKLLHSNDNMI